MSDYIEGDVRCPFFREVNRKERKIRCEGLVDQSNIHLIYRKLGDITRQVEVFCCDRYENCEIYRAIMEAKYQD